MKIIDFRKYLKTLSKEEMESELLNLVKNYEDVKEYFSLKVNPENEEEIFLKYKENIKKELSIRADFKNPNFKEIRRYYVDFKKVSKNIDYLIELMLYTVELALKNLEKSDYWEDKFYESISKIFGDIFVLIYKNNLEEKYIPKCKELLEFKVVNSYGISSLVEEYFYNYFGIELKKMFHNT